jgi:hypothetical protein
MDCLDMNMKVTKRDHLINLRSREFNIICEVSGDVNTTRCVTWGFIIHRSAFSTLGTSGILVISV